MGLLRFALWAIVILLILRFIGRIFRASFHFEVITPHNRGNQRQPPGGKPQSSGAAEMVQDPSCGAWIAAGQAVKVNTGAITQYFCSQQCLDNYRKKLNG